MLTKLKQISINNYLGGSNKTGNPQEEILHGLLHDPKYIPSKYFYDERGSELFEKITHLPEYYPPRTEKKLIVEAAEALRPVLHYTDIVELGSGDCSKISILMNAIPAEYHHTMRYFAFDVSESAILKSVYQLSDRYPNIPLYGLVADFHDQLHIIPNSRKRIICFFGSTIGNFNRDDSVIFLNTLAQAMHTGDILLLGLDRVKERTILERAYNDSQNITAAFNKNILQVVNRFIGTQLNPLHFEHWAFFNEKESRIEMHLEAKRSINTYASYAGIEIALKKGERIHTENSYKFSTSSIEKLISATPFENSKTYSDPMNWFSILHLEKT